MGEVDATDRFAAVVQRPEPELRLDEAALLIAAHAYPDLDIDAERGRLDELAEHCYAPTLDALIDRLFVELGFHGNRDDYYDPRNSFLNDVVTRRTGIPITLSVLTIEVGRRIGVPVAGVSLPGHFLLRDRVDPSVFVDPFGGGRLLDERACERVFRTLHGAGTPFDESLLEPVGARPIVARMLANLKSIYLARSDRRGLAWVLRLRSLLPGAADGERRELAGALAAAGRYDEAADELEQLAEELPGVKADEATAAARRLRARLN